MQFAVASRPSPTWISDAGRVGASRSHLDRLAASQTRLARKIRADSLGLCRDRSTLAPFRARVHPREGWANAETGSMGTFQGKVDFKQIDFIQLPTDRVWTRDSGPIFLTNDRGKIAVTDWKFNAWAK